MEKRITDLEKILSFQENTIGVLNEVILEHSRQIDWLNRKIILLEEKINSNEDIMKLSDEVPPPHY